MCYDLTRGLSSQLDLGDRNKRSFILGSKSLGRPNAIKISVEKLYKEYLLCISENKEMKDLCVSLLEEFKLYIIDE